MPRACSACFIRMPGTLAMPPPGKSAGRLNMISIVWLAGSALSVLRRSDQVTVILRSGISTSARTASSGSNPEARRHCLRAPDGGADIASALLIVRVLLVENDALRHRRRRLRTRRRRAWRLSGALLLRNAPREFGLR